MGVVFQAQNINLDSERAVKILHPMLAQRKDIAGSFVREAQITDKLDHPNIVRVYEVGTFSEFFFIEMELIDTFQQSASDRYCPDNLSEGVRGASVLTHGQFQA